MKSDLTSNNAMTEQLVSELLAGRREALARAISMLERGQSDSLAILKAVHNRTGSAKVIGLTGAPGAGKSTLTNVITVAFRQRDLRVGIIAVDPSSPATGGALLGDRVRMNSAAEDPGVFVRSIASRGSLGGLSPVVYQVVDLMDAAGFDVILVETVGVGQSETTVVEVADINLLVCAPGLGDEVQAQKAGIMEVVDALVVNKSDRPDADSYRKRFTAALPERGGGRPILAASALKNEGIDALCDALWTLATAKQGQQHEQRRRRHIQHLLAQEMTRQILEQWTTGDDDRVDQLCEAVRRGELTLGEAVGQLLVRS